MFTNFPVLARFRQCFVDAAGHWYGFQDRRKQDGLNFLFQELASNQEILQANQEALQAIKRATSR